MKKYLVLLIALLTVCSTFAASPSPSSDVYPRVYGTNRTDTILNTAITAVGTRVCRMVIDGGSWTIANSVTFPTNVQVFIVAGSKLNIANGKTVTFNGGFEAGPYDVFDGAGTTAGSPKMIYRLAEWGDVTAYPMGDGEVNNLLTEDHTVSAVWLITNAASSFGGVLGANIPDLTAVETVSGAWVHSANLTLDDGAGDSPSFILKDADDKTLTIAKLDTGNTTWTSTEGDFTFTPYGDDVLIDGGLTVGSTTEAGDNNLRVEGTGTIVGTLTVTGAILGNLGAGATTIAINSSDWDITAAGNASGLGTIGCDGNITLTAASGSATISAIGASGEDGILLLDADAGANNADSWFLKSEADDNLLYFINHTTTAATLSGAGDLITIGDIHVTGNDITSTGDLTLTPAGDDVLIDGGLNVGGTTQPGDNNLRVEGTSALVGAVTASDAITVAGDITANGGIIGDGATDITLVDEATFVDLTVTNNPSLNGRYALYSKDATTQYATEHGTCTNGQVVSFTTAFAVAPQIFLTYQAAVAITNNPYAASISVNGFTAGGAAAISMGWLAIGQK